MDLHSIQRIYKVFSLFYDASCCALLRPGRMAAIKAMELFPGASILEVGVGTGLQLPLYPRNVRVVGIDICDDMLKKAIARKKYMQLNHVELHNMNAMEIDLGDHQFDAIMAAHVISVVPDPQKTISEMRRLLKPNGTIVFLNHSNTGNGHSSRFKQFITPVTQHLGFRSDINVIKLAEECGLETLYQQRVNVFKLWTVVKCRPLRPAGEKPNAVQDPDERGSDCDNAEPSDR